MSNNCHLENLSPGSNTNDAPWLSEARIKECEDCEGVGFIAEEYCTYCKGQGFIELDEDN